MGKTLLKRFVVASLALTAANMQAQTVAQWQPNHPTVHTTPMMLLTPASESAPKAQAPAKAAKAVERINVGLCSNEAIIYESDGVSLQQDCNVGCAVKFDKDLLSTYTGGKITALRIGWNTRNYKPSITAFVRKDLNGENLASKKFTPQTPVGWNEVKLDKNLDITEDLDSLFLGFTLKLEKGKYIPTLYPHNVENSCILAQEGDVDASGKQIWRHLPDLGQLAIMAVVQDTDGKLHNMVKLANFRYDAIVNADSASTTMAYLTNMGSNEVNTLGVECRQGDKVWEYEMQLSNSVQPGATSKISLPLYCFGTGRTDYSVKYVNGEDPRKSFSTTLDQIGVPKDVAKKYVHRPLIEFYTSENNFYGPRFYGYVKEGLGDLQKKFTLVKVHCEDQFMTGTDDDDALRMYLDFVDNDSMQVYLPGVSIDRNAYTCNLAGRGIAIDHTLYPQAGQQIYPVILEYPTFAGISATGSVADDLKSVSIDVTGEIAEGVMPKDEPLYVSVYLMENDVKSKSQKFYGEEEEAEWGGEYIHDNVIRRRLTPLYGTKLEKNSGPFTMHLTQRLSPKWDASKLSVVAFINRGLEMPSSKRQVINSTEAVISVPQGITNVTGEDEGRVVAVYNLQGVEVPVGVKPAKGVYLVKRMVGGQIKVSKEFVR